MSYPMAFWWLPSVGFRGAAKPTAGLVAVGVRSSVFSPLAPLGVLPGRGLVVVVGGGSLDVSSLPWLSCQHPGAFPLQPAVHISCGRSP